MRPLCFILIGALLTSPSQGRRHRKDCIGSYKLCGSNGVTYLNYCHFEEAQAYDPYLEIEERGPCKCTKEEKYEWDPICGTDMDIYANYCELQKAKTYDNNLRLRHRDLCNEFLERDVIFYRELQKVMRWKSFMPKELYAELVKRPVYDTPVYNAFIIYRPQIVT